jgi:hypothetical protein
MNVKRSAVFALSLFLVVHVNAATRDNDDSCDIATLPAATLLLPYFEVDLDDVAGETTLFTVTNVTNADRIARVTLWTDYAYPVLAFNIYLTGYDVQAINLYDVLQRGLIAPDAGTGTAVTNRGAFSDPNHEIDLTGCARLPGALPPHEVQRIKAAFRDGFVPEVTIPICNAIGGTHANAIGYATIDVVRTCSSHFPTEPRYWTEDIAFDNVLIGDYQQLDGRNDFAQSNSMVHIRAIPDAGFPRTFYSRYQAAGTPRFDARQPLPSTFAARWIEGGSGSFQTSYKIWREGKTDGSCTDAERENELPFVESVRLDEAENAVGSISRHHLPGIELVLYLPPASRTSVSDTYVFPQLTNGAVAGWIYLNLHSDAVAGQNWVVTSMRAEGRYSGDMDATTLGNGCSPKAPLTEISGGTAILGPAANVNP